MVSDEQLRQKAVHVSNKYHPDGIVHALSIVPAATVTDGLSNTYLVGEKNVNVDAYSAVADGGDNENMYIGSNGDIVRWGGPGMPLVRDRPGYPAAQVCFGSAHSAGVNMGFCDGSVRTMRYSLDANVHRRLANRRDGEPIDNGAF